MADEELGLEVFVEGWRQFENIMSRLDKSIDGLEKEMESTSKTSGTFSVALGTLAATVVTKLAEAFVDAGKKIADFTLSSIKEAADFQDSMVILASAASGTGLTFEELKEAALAVGGDTRILGASATGAAAAMTGLYKSGLSTTEIFGDLNAFMEDGAELGGALGASFDLASASALDVEAASDLAAVALATFGSEFKTEADRADFVTKAMNNFVKTADASVSEVGDLAAALVTVGPIAAGLGIPLEDVNTALAILSTRGLTGATAGTNLKSMLENLQRPTDAVKGALADLNVDLFDANGNFVGLPKLVEDLSQAMFGVNEITVEVGGRTGEQNALLEEASKRYESLTRRINNHKSGLNVMSDKALAKANAELEASKAVITDLGSITGTLVTKTKKLTEEERNSIATTIAGNYGKVALMSLLKEQSTLTEDGVAGWDSMSEAIDKATGIEEIAAAKSKTFNAQMEALDGVIETVKIRIGDALLPVATELVQWFSAMIEEHGPAIQAAFSAVAEAISGLVRWFIAVIDDGDTLNDFLTTLPEPIQAIIKWFTGFADILGTILPTAIALVSNIFTTQFGFIKGALGAVAEQWDTKLKPAFETLFAWLSENLPSGIKLLTGIWENIWKPALEIVWGFITDSLIPALGDIVAFLITNIPTAIETAKAFWEETLKPALEAVWTFITESLVPAFETVVAWLSINIPLAMQAIETFWTGTLKPAFEAIEKWLIENIPIAIETVQTWWETVFKPALETVWKFIVDNIIPIFLDVVEWLQTNIPLATEALALIWENTLKPALELVWKFINEDLLPLFESLRKFFAEALTLALEAIAGIWENTLKPALETVWEFLRDSLMPILKDLADFFKVTFILAMEKANPILEGIKLIFEAISGTVGDVIGWINDLTEKLKAIELPDWMTPGSPTPLELGLRGIAGAMQEVAGLSQNLFAGAPRSIAVGMGGNGVAQTAAPGMQVVNNITNNREGDQFTLNAQSAMQPGQLAMEFSTMSMRSR